MSSHLTGTVSKFNRAIEHLHELDRVVTGYMGSDFGAITVETQPNPDQGIVRVQIHEAFPMWDIGVRLGDVVHNLRSALDHLVEQLTILNRGKPLPRSEFPIFTDSGKFHEREGGKLVPRSGLFKIRGVSGPGRTVIETLQPYHRSNDVLQHPLWLLHQLDIIDKHRTVVTTALIMSDVSVTFLAPDGVLVSSDVHGVSGRLEDGTELGRISVIRPPGMEQANVEVQANPTVDVVFEAGPPGFGRPVMPTLGDIAMCVMGILSYFGPWFE